MPTTFVHADAATLDTLWSEYLVHLDRWKANPRAATLNRLMSQAWDRYQQEVLRVQENNFAAWCEFDAHIVNKSREWGTLG